MNISLPAPGDAPWLASAVWLVVRATLLLAAAGLVSVALRRRSAAARHLAWGVGMTALLALPALSLVLPRWSLSFVSVDSIDRSLGAGAGVASRGMDWGAAALVAWAAGAAVILLRMGVAMLGVRALARRARPLQSGAWMARMRGAAAELGMRPDVRLLQARGGAMPMTWGVLRPTVLLPAEADDWSPERTRVVLLHELAHVARRDCLWQTLAGLCCAAYWFHPGAWWAARRMREEREQACDDRVLAAGTRASDYAGHLLAVARAFRPARLTAVAAVAMAARSQLEERVVAVLDGARTRGAVPARAALLFGGLAAVALFPIAAAAPTVEEEAGPTELPAVAVAPPALKPLGGGRLPTTSSAPAAGTAEKARPRAATREPEIAPELLPGDEATIAALSAAARDVDPAVRRSAVWALGQMDDRLAVAALLRSMGDRDARVRSAAALALGEYQTRQRTTTLAEQTSCESDACRPVPTGSGRNIQPPRTARTDRNDRTNGQGLRILSGLVGSDTLFAPQAAP